MCRVHAAASRRHRGLAAGHARDVSLARQDGADAQMIGGSGGEGGSAEGQKEGEGAVFLDAGREAGGIEEVSAVL